ncbi:MAG: hypothetical protein A2939_01910 [Parcubacteria group bacterium RIFCSPLOWO2_01_FULL_48_18]|nr:MAG: hypothetical protein A2939_01910 [Parcubacteria group bacterium RIFCSPLOWO2_01_FULL_48_18]
MTEAFHPEKEAAKAEELEQFHFGEIAELEPAMASLVEQLKEKIEAGEYDTLISDEIGGRIPTLVLRKIIKTIRPNANLETYFISSGKTYLPSEGTEDYRKLFGHIQKITRNTRKALIVTQFIFKGGTVSALYRLLEKAGVEDVGVAALRYAFLERIGFPKEKLYIGTRDRSIAIDEEHFDFFGVRKPEKKSFSPHPLHITKVIEKEGRELSMDEWREVFGIEPRDLPQDITRKSEDPKANEEWERRTHAPLSSEERARIQNDIHLARKDVSLLADNVVERIWGKQEERKAA